MALLSASSGWSAGPEPAEVRFVESQPASPIRLKWSGWKGRKNEDPSTWKSSHEWIWSRLGGSRPSDTAALKVRIEIPAGLRISSLSFDPSLPWTMAGIEAEPPALVIETASGGVRMSAVVKETGEGGEAIEHAVRLKLEVDSSQGPILWLQPSCAGLGIHVAGKAPASRKDRPAFLFAGVACEGGDPRQIHLSFSAGASLRENSTGDAAPASQGEGRATFRLATAPLRFRLGERRGRREQEFTVALAGSAETPVVPAAPARAESYDALRLEAARTAEPPGAADRSLAEGEKLLADGKTRQALEIFRGSRKLDPELLDGWFFELKCLRQLHLRSDEKQLRRELLSRHPELSDLPMFLPGDKSGDSP